MKRIRSESGSALLIVLTITFLFSALAIGTATAVGIETTVSARFSDSTEALFVAEAGVSIVVAELRPLPDWTPVLQGAAPSPLSRGAFGGAAAVAGGGTVLLCCGAGSVAGRLAGESAASPVPARRALAWHPVLWSPWDALVAQPVRGQLFISVSVQDDEEDGDAYESTDLNGVVRLRSEVTRPDGLRKVVEALVAREPGIPAGVRVLAWRELR